jgi:hypothetical protein
VSTITHWSIYRRGSFPNAPSERIALVPGDQAITTLVEYGMEPDAARSVIERGMSITVGELTVIATHRAQRAHRCRSSSSRRWT